MTSFLKRRIRQYTEPVFILKQPSTEVIKKDVMRIHKKTSVLESRFRCFLVNFAKVVRTPFLHNSTERLLLIIAVSIITKES